MQEGHLVCAGLFGLGYFCFWLQGRGSSPGGAGSRAVNAGAGATPGHDPTSWLSASAVASMTDTEDLSEPDFNVDGTPMVGLVDTNGNPYGVTETQWDVGDVAPSSLSSTEDTWSDMGSTAYMDICSPSDNWGAPDLFSTHFD